MIKSMYKKPTGFTIIELLIVIAVMAILAAIVVVGWNGVSVQSRNTARANELETWKSTFELYKTRFSTYPSQATGSYCLGSSFSTGKCADTSSSTAPTVAASTGLMNELKRVSPTLPSVSTSAVATYAGPYAIIGATDIKLIGAFESNNSCPDDLVVETSVSNGLTLCKYTLTY